MPMTHSSPQQMISILHLTLSMKAGGLERVINQLVQRTDKALFKVYIGCMVEGGSFLDGLDRYGVESIVFGKEPAAIDIKLIKKITSFIRENKIDIIHSHSGTMIYSAIAGRLGKVKGIIHTDHGRHYPEQWKVVLEERISSIFLSNVVGVSKDLTEYLRKRVGINPQKLTTIINGVDTTTFSPDLSEDISLIKKELGVAERDKVIGTVCRFTTGKNLPLLMQAVSDIKKKVSNIKLVLAGDGEEMDNLKRISHDLEIDKLTVFTGWRNDMEKILKIFNIFVLPSLSEGTSMTILEA
ncbi:MAG: glycosyltransferase, partial [Nitrospirota bacterium]